MNCNHRCYECHIPACPDRVRQSIGPRIVPMFADPPEWSADKVYSPLTLVIHNGATYMSRRCVPANTALPDTDPFYNESWVMVYDMNAQVAQYREEVAQLSQQVTDFGGKIDNWEQLIVQWTALIQGWQNQFPELAKDLAAITERVAAIEPQLAQALEDITALQTTQQTHTEQIAANTQGLADLTPRVAAAETHLSALDEEQKVQDEHLNNLDASQTEQDTRIQAAHNLAVQAKNTADNNTQQITENAGKIAANAAEIAKHAEQLEALKAADTALDGKISQNTAAIAQNTADIAQAKTDIKQAAAAAQRAQDTATHADAAASKAQTTAEAAQEAAEAAQSAADQAKADNTTQDGRLDALEAKITQEVEDRTEADNAIKQEIANLTDGTTELPYVKKSGDTMTGALNMQNHKVTNVAAPTETADATNKGYVDTAISGLTNGTTAMPYVKKAGDTMSGALMMGGYSIGNAYSYQLTGPGLVQFVTSNAEAAISTIGDADNYKVLNVATPVKDTHAATKKYVDQAVQNATGGITPDVSKLKQDVAALQESQTTQDSQISAAAQTAQTAQETAQAAKTTADQAAQDVASIKNGSTALPYIKDTGDTVTGTYDFTGADLTVKAPTAEASPATKAYVDSAVQNAKDPELAERVTAVENTNTVQDGKIDALQTQMQNLQNGTINLPYLPLIGGALTGAVTTNRQNFGENELVTKKYVDKQTGNKGENGHLQFLNSAKLAPTTAVTITRESGVDYCFTEFITIKSNPGVLGGVILSDWNASSGMNGSYMVTANASEIKITNNSPAPAIVTVYKFVSDGDQPTPPPDPTTSFTTLSGDYSSAISVQGTGSNKASNTEALQTLVDGTKGNLYKFTDHAGTVYWFTCANAVTMTGDTVTVADCDYVVGNGTTVYSGGTLVFKTEPPEPTQYVTFTRIDYTAQSEQYTGADGYQNALNFIDYKSYKYVYKTMYLAKVANLYTNTEITTSPQTLENCALISFGTQNWYGYTGVTATDVKLS